jgi:hypothetical protein
MPGSKVIAVALAALAPGWVRAAETAQASSEKLRSFGLAESGATPAFGRVIVVFLLIAALAWGIAWFLKRHGRRFGLAGAEPAASGASAIRHLARSGLPGGIVCHLVEAQGSRVLITVSRHGVSSVALGDAPPAEKAP